MLAPSNPSVANTASAASRMRWTLASPPRVLANVFLAQVPLAQVPLAQVPLARVSLARVSLARVSLARVSLLANVSGSAVAAFRTLRLWAARHAVMSFSASARILRPTHRIRPHCQMPREAGAQWLQHYRLRHQGARLQEARLQRTRLQEARLGARLASKLASIRPIQSRRGRIARELRNRDRYPQPVADIRDRRQCCPCARQCKSERGERRVRFLYRPLGVRQDHAA